MDQNTSVNTNDIKWELTTPVKFNDKDCGEVEIVGSGTFSYQVTDRETFSASAAQSNMDAETYAKGVLLSFVIEEIGKYSGKLAFSLPSLIKSENILTNANGKITRLGFTYIAVSVENIKLTEASEKKMQVIETTKIKSAITGREIVGTEVPTEQVPAATDGSVAPEGEKLPEKRPSVLGIIIMAIVIAVAIMFLFR